MPLLPGAEPYRQDGGPVGALLLHGFTGCPQTLRPWAEYLSAAGLSVLLPRLPGHGTRWQQLAVTRAADWCSAADAALTELRSRCAEVFVMGLSAGAALGLHLAAERRDDVRGLVFVNPCVLLTDPRLRWLPLLARLRASVPGVVGDVRRPGVAEVGYRRVPTRALESALEFWAEVRRELPKVRAPLLVYRSALDHVVPRESTAAVLAGVGSAEVLERVCRDSYHVATLDFDAAAIFAGSLAFVRRHSGVLVGGPP